MNRGTFTHDGWTLSYEDHGEGPRVTVLMHGLLLDAGVNRQLARAMAAQGHRVILLELLGHGRSDRPTRASLHRMDFYADQVVSLLDHLEIDQAVIGGVSLGAGVALMAGHRHPDRCRGLLLEMPVLENATPFAAMLFVPYLLAMHYGAPVAKGLSRLVNRVPRTGIEAVDSFLQAAGRHPDESKAVLHGLLMGPLGPTEAQRMAMTMPTLVIGHNGDPLHPHTDAARLARQMPNATMLKARTPLELRATPGRLTGEIITFIERTWAAQAVPDVG